MSEDFTKEYSRLFNIISQALRSVPYYRDNSSYRTDDVNINYFKNLPILKKNIVLNHEKLFISENYDINNLELTKTSGSTGKILNVYWDKRELTRSYLSLWSIRKKYGILPFDKRLQFHSNAVTNYGVYDKEYISSPRVILQKNNMVLSLSKINISDEILFKYYDIIKKFKPKWIFTQPSMLYLLADFLQKNKLKKLDFITYIELTGEYLTSEVEEKIQDTFSGIPIINHYGSQEVNGIAVRCDYGNLHCLSDNVYIEILKDKKIMGYGEIGEVCVTSLCNNAMPLIRYNLEDQAIMYSGEKCPCGNKHPILDLKKGRANDFIYLKDNKLIDPIIFFHFMEVINSIENNKIIQFKVIQKSHNNFKIILVVKDITDKDILKNLFLKEVENSEMKDTNWEFLFQENFLEYDGIGKIQYFKREFEK